MGGAKGLLLIIKNGLTNHENLPPPLYSQKDPTVLHAVTNSLSIDVKTISVPISVMV